jgi:hypothetical protein
MSNAGGSISKTVVLPRTGKAACLVETGYICPAAVGVFDMHFSIRTDRRYFVARDPDHPEVHQRGPA